MADELRDAWAVRRAVFVEEQGVPAELEIDESDALESTIHVVEYTAAGRAIGTGRAVLDAPGRVHLGRIAVLPPYRGTGVGTTLVRRLEDKALERHGVVTTAGRCVVLELAAQEHAIEFYRALGYELTPRPRYLDAGIWHRDMRRTACQPVGGPT